MKRMHNPPHPGAVLKAGVCSDGSQNVPTNWGTDTVELTIKIPTAMLPHIEMIAFAAGTTPEKQAVLFLTEHIDQQREAGDNEEAIQKARLIHDFDPFTATIEDASRRDDAIYGLNPPPLNTTIFPLDPSIKQWLYAQDVKRAECQYAQSKDRKVLLPAIYSCAVAGLKIPEWLQFAFCTAYRKAQTFEAASWDEVFGELLAKGEHRHAKHQARTLPLQIYAAMKERIIVRAHYDNKTSQIRDVRTRALDASLFDEVGKEFNISGKLAENMYYRLIKHHELCRPLSEIPLVRGASSPKNPGE
jgi:hypothetical protein